MTAAAYGAPPVPFPAPSRDAFDPPLVPWVQLPATVSPAQPLGNADAVGAASVEVATASYHVLRALGIAAAGASDAERAALAAAATQASAGLTAFMAALAARGGG